MGMTLPNHKGGDPKLQHHFFLLASTFTGGGYLGMTLPNQSMEILNHSTIFFFWHPLSWKGVFGYDPSKPQHGDPKPQHHVFLLAWAFEGKGVYLGMILPNHSMEMLNHSIMFFFWQWRGGIWV